MRDNDVNVDDDMMITMGDEGDPSPEEEASHRFPHPVLEASL